MTIRPIRTANAREKSNDLEAALQQCQTAARRSYQIAMDNLHESSETIKRVSKSLFQCLKKHEDSSVRTTGIDEKLNKQIVIVANELEQHQRTTEKNMEERRQRLDRFSITLFGRTMAGKSTLMEILTRGDGQSIGLGAQRKTRDVRSYTWKGLDVTDVPGVGAFEGSEDEELAFKAAAQADLVLFLVTDDAPQPVEVECLARVKRLGKPVLGICNVKAAIDDEDDLLLFLRNPDRLFDHTRLDQLLNQFHAFADQHITGKHIPFVVTHLRSRFLAERKEFAKHRLKLLQASRFSVVESRIISEVKQRGAFLRIKSFVDGAVDPMIRLIKMLLDFSAQNSDSGRVLIDKQRQLQKWLQGFKTDGQERITTLVSKLMDGLRGDVSDFTEEHYDDNRVGEGWSAHVESTGINEKVKNLQHNMLEECKNALSEVARELKKELSFVAEFAGDRSIKMDSIFDSKRWWNWGTSSLASGIGIAALILGSNPFGWAAAAVGGVGWLLSYCFVDREKKTLQSRTTLSESLHNDINKMERELRRQLDDWLYQELLSKQVQVLLNDLKTVTSGIFDLADAQRTLAWTLNDRQKKLGRILVEEALLHANAAGMEHHIRDIARVPGCAIMFLIAPTTKFPEQIKKDIEYLLEEKIWFVIDTGNQKSILTQAIGHGCEKNKISIEEKLKIAHVPLDKLDALTQSRVLLAQQLTGLHVMR